MSALGDSITDPVRLVFPRPKKTAQGWQAYITIIDIFGNLTTDLPSKYITNVRQVSFQLKDHHIGGIVQSYRHREPGEPVTIDYLKVFM